MAAPAIQVAEAPFTGQPWGALVEALLRAHGLTNSSYSGTDATYTTATATQVAEAKQCVQEALVYLGEQRDRWFSMSEDDITAATPYTRASLPLDFASFGKGGAFISGKRLILLNTEQYAANVRSDSDGGGIQCAEVAGDATHARLVVVKNTVSLIDYYGFALDVFPRQTAAWTAHIVYNATAKAISADATIVRVPTRLQPILEDLSMSAWAKKRADFKKAAALKALAVEALEDVEEAPGEQLQMVMRSAVPSEATAR